ncbi:hypothetical protein AVEN_62419-2-1, partial [Araneus ventricosus]
ILTPRRIEFAKTFDQSNRNSVNTCARIEPQHIKNLFAELPCDVTRMDTCQQETFNPGEGPP